MKQPFVSQTPPALVLLLFAVCLLMPALAQAQFPSRTSEFVVSPEENRIQLDLFTIPGSVTVEHADSLLHHSYYTLNPWSGVLTFHWPSEWLSLPVTLTVTWQYRPASLVRNTRLREPIEIDADQAQDSDQLLLRRTQPPPDASRLRSSGSITRGVIAGSGRDLGLESGLRFDLQGYITDDVYITASLSDQNTLIQPDGTTQNLREFDQVFIRLDAPRTSVQLGDIDVSMRRSNIARLQRRLQGAQGGYRFGESDDFQAAAAVIRGTYRVMEFRGREGIQGPYRLTNSANETFILVVAGTEQVYLDGRLLQRGEDLDYTIDYSIGEITFTNRRIIRNAHRIRVEYQYLSTTYSRTLAAAEADVHDLAGGRVQLGATFIRESDNITFDDATGLTEADIRVLRDAGTDTNSMRVSGADSVGFRRDAPFILYTRIDTIIAGQPQIIYRNIPGDPDGHFRVQFSRVEPGTGSYRRAGRNVNGIVYEWVGAGNGDYEPFRQLSPPESRQVLALRAGADVTRYLSANTEWAVSSLDQNRYSETVSGKNDQMLRAGLALEAMPLGEGLLDMHVLHEYKGQNFVFFDRVRAVEFERLWDTDAGITTTENRSEAGIRYSQRDYLMAGYTVQRLDRDDQSGIRHDISFMQQLPDWPDLRADAGYLQSSSQIRNSQTRFGNLSAESGYALSTASGLDLRPFYRVDAEERVRRSIDADALQNDSFRWIDHGPGVSFSGPGSARLALLYSYRSDFEPLDGILEESFRTYSPEAELQFTRGAWWQSENRLAWRRQLVTTRFREETDRSDVEGVAIRTSNDFRFLNRALETSLLYDAATESRAILQETYLEVGAEFGQYVWVDVNGDGVQQIDEFFPEQSPNEGTFIRQLLPSDELFPVISLQLRWRTLIDPSRLGIVGSSENRLHSFLAGIRYRSVVDLREQNETEQIRDIYFLRPGAFRDPDNTISGRIRWDQELQLFRGIRQFDLRLRRDVVSVLTRQSAGLETGRRADYSTDAVYRPAPRWNLSLRTAWLERNTESAEIQSRNFDIVGWELIPGIRWSDPTLLQTGFQVTVGRRVDRNNTQDAILQAFRISNDWMVFIGEGLRLTARAEYRRMALDGQSTSLGEFELTDGAGTGTSWQWNMQASWRATELIQASIQYDGRTTRTQGVIQTLRMTVSAVF